MPSAGRSFGRLWTGADTPYRVTAVLFAALLLLGGGGAPAPLMQAVLEAAGFAVLAYLVWAERRVAPFAGSAAALGLIAAMLTLALIQLLPLPPVVWRLLPGREVAGEVVRLAGLGGAWMPWSLVPEGTRLAVLQLIPATAVFVGVSMATPRQRVLLSRIPIAVAALSAVIGAAQAASPGNAGLYLFPRSVFTTASGLFANRNFQSDLLLAAILLCSYQIRAETIERERDPRTRIRNLVLVWLGIMPLLAIMVLATLSRAGALLLGPVLLASYFIARGRRAGALELAIGAGAIALVVILFATSPTFLAPLLERFESPNGRSEAWPDLFVACLRYFPFGAGLGTFDPIFRSVESLSFVSNTYFNHAHDDYIEIVLETGLLGVALVIAFYALFVPAAWRAWAVAAVSRTDWLRRVATLTMLILLGHSLVDYPLRTITLQALFAFMAAVLFAPAQRQRAARTVA